MNPSSQKFIARNRAPRVQIEYDVELYGAQQRIELPFVMGVLADLGGRGPERPPLSARRFVDIDIHSFDERLRALQPALSLRVPDAGAGGDAQLPVALQFRCLDDFSPDAVARQVPVLRRLLDARTQLKDLLTYLDGKTDVEALLAHLLDSPQALAALQADAGPPGAGHPRPAADAQGGPHADA